MKILIIGGGASGMMAALSAAENPENRVTLLERQNRVGRKLLATGNGRCNLTNADIALSRYPGGGSFASNALRRFSKDDTLAFFANLGLYTVTDDTGRCYPLSDQANSVVDVLRFSLEQAGVATVTSCDVIEAKKTRSGFSVTAADGQTFTADRLIVTAGGCAGKGLGGTKSGYRLLEQLGHHVTALHPSLVQIKTEPAPKSLKGVRADAKITVKGAGESAGEVQFTDFGISGPAAFDVSRTVSLSESAATLLLDFMRDYSEETLLARLQDRAARFPRLPAEQLLIGMLNTRLGQVLLKHAEIPRETPLSDLTEAQLKTVAHTLKYYPMTAVGVLGMDHAQVTAGGVYTDEFRADTLESRIVPGLFAAGEVLDVDGDCGGFNLQWAWSSGYVAGKLGAFE